MASGQVDVIANKWALLSGGSRVQLRVRNYILRFRFIIDLNDAPQQWREVGIVITLYL